MKNNLLPTRAQVNCAGNITPARLAARTKTAIAEIEKRIEALSLPYEDIDNSVMGAKDELAAAFEKFKLSILETQKYLEETA